MPLRASDITFPKDSPMPKKGFGYYIKQAWFRTAPTAKCWLAFRIHADRQLL